MDPEFRKMMIAVLIALVIAVVAGLVIVHFTMQYFNAT